MSVFAIIKDGVVINHAEASEEFASSQGWIPAADSRIGDLWDGGTFTKPSVDLTELKHKKNLEINEARLAANFSTFPYLGKTFNCDVLSRSDIDGTNGYISLNASLPADWPGGWKAVDNTYIPISSVQDWKAFYGAIFEQGNSNFIRAQTLKTKIQEANSESELSSITWNMEL